MPCQHTSSLFLVRKQLALTESRNGFWSYPAIPARKGYWRGRAPTPRPLVCLHTAASGGLCYAQLFQQLRFVLPARFWQSFIRMIFLCRACYPFAMVGRSFLVRLCARNRLFGKKSVSTRGEGGKPADRI